jgi:hypothetical protein
MNEGLRSKMQGPRDTNQPFAKIALFVTAADNVLRDFLANGDSHLFVES